MGKPLQAAFLVADHHGIRGEGDGLDVAADRSLQLLQGVGDVPGLRRAAGHFINYFHIPRPPRLRFRVRIPLPS